MCVILDTYNNNTRIHIVKTRITYNGGSKVVSRRKQTNKKIKTVQKDVLHGCSMKCDARHVKPLSSLTKICKKWFPQLPCLHSAFRGDCKGQAGNFACCVVGQDILCLLCGRQVVYKPWKWQLPSECEPPVQNIAIQFAFSCMEDKHG